VSFLAQKQPSQIEADAEAARIAAGVVGDTAVPRNSTGRVPSRLLIYGINFAPELIGVGRFTAELCTHLSGSGADIDVVTTPPHYPGWSLKAPYRWNWYRTEQAGRIRVTRCPLLLRKNMSGIWRMLAPLTFAMSSAPIAIWRILKTRPDVVIAIEPAFFVTPIALLAAKLVGAKTVLHVQDLEIDAAFAVGHLRGNFVQRMAHVVESKILSGFDHVVTISSQMRTRLEAKGIEAARLSIVRNWVDLKKIKPLDGPNSFRAELGLSDQTFVALYAGNIGPKQGLPVLLDAAEKLQHVPNVTFVVAGDGPAKSALVARYGHLANLHFLPTQPEQRLCELLNLADVHVLPQMSGTADLVLPSKLGGMLASGRQIAVTANEGSELYDFLRDIAVIVPAGRSDRLAEEIQRLAQDRPRADVEKSLQLAKTFDSERNLALFSSILAELCDNGVQKAWASASSASTVLPAE
jgi:colanic acid biosynthesis glycosyl transferase WcaI